MCTVRNAQYENNQMRLKQLMRKFERVDKPGIMYQKICVSEEEIWPTDLQKVYPIDAVLLLHVSYIFLLYTEVNPVIKTPLKQQSL